MEFPGFEYVDTVYKTLNASAFTVSTLWVVKSFAVVFLGINLIKKYIEGGTERDGTTWGLKPKDLLTSLSSILLVIFCTEILSFLDSILGSIEQGFKDTAPQLRMLPVADLEIEEDPSMWDVFSKAAEKTVELLTSPFTGMEILASIISLILWGIDIFIYPLFLAERFFLMGIMRVLFPIVITFSVLDKFKDLQWKFYKLYIGLYLVAPAFFLVNVFINKLYDVFREDFFDNLLGDWSAIIPDSFSSLMILTFILLLKFKLYRKSHDFVLRMFS